MIICEQVIRNQSPQGVRGGLDSRELLHELFEDQVARRPDAVAVVCENSAITYADLNRQANQFARRLKERGAGPDDIVAICVERGIGLIVGVLATLKCGAAYLPLDINQPTGRLAYMLTDSKPVALICESGMANRLPKNIAPLILIDGSAEGTSLLHDSNYDAGATAQQGNLAYVIYTSGSTGQPKGVMVEHRNVVSMVHWFCFEFGVKAGHRYSCVAAIGFDAAVWEIWPPLTAGGTLVISPPSLGKDPQALLAWWSRQSLDVCFLPTPIAELAFNERIHNEKLRVLTVGGDRLRCRPTEGSYRLVNNYGPTETTVVATSGEIDSDEQTLHIGRPVSHAHVYILDAYQRALPTGQIGEIYIGGAGVARGYLQRPALSAERFLADPFSADVGSRMYRSGDLGRRMESGVIEFIGRVDEQVKIRGYRIELGEIETQLLGHERVKEAVVVVREDDGDKRLVAYVSTRKGNLDPEELHDHLSEFLPEYMVPALFVVLNELPLTPNGKLDRRALPAPDAAALVSREYEPPQGDMEALLAEIWRDLLRVEQVGRRDNFFALGGHSLLIVQMMDRLRQAGVSAQGAAIFDRPTLADLASALRTDAAPALQVPPNRVPPGSAVITPEMLTLVDLSREQIQKIVQAVPGGAKNIQDIYPLAPLQEGILFHHKLDRQGWDTYVLPVLLTLSSHEKLSEFISALNHVIRRHDAFRTAIFWEGLDRPVQVVCRSAPIQVEQFELDPDRDPMVQLRERMRPEQQQLDLQKPPLMKLQVTSDLKSKGWYAVLQFHHLIADHESGETMLAEISEYVDGNADELPPTVPYRDHVAQSLEYARTHDSEGFFRSKLQDIVEPTAPFDLTDVRGDSSRIDVACEAVDPTLSREVRAQARRLGVSPATLFHAGWALVMAKTSGRDDVVFGTVLLGRIRGNQGTQRMLGLLVNTLPLRFRLLETTTIGLVEQTNRELVELLHHEHASLALAQRCSGIAGSVPLFSALFNYLHSTFHIETGQPIVASGIQSLVSQEWTNYPVVLSVDDQGEDFALIAQSDRRIDPRRFIRYLRAAMQSLVNGLRKEPDRAALELDIVPEEERHHLTVAVNQTTAVGPYSRPIHELFQSKVTETPDAVAVVFEEQALTYAELNGRANQLARYLTARSVGAGQYIPLLISRNSLMVVAQLAVLKCGAAYVPADPTWPEERLQHIMADCGASVVLSDRSPTTQLARSPTGWINLTDAVPALAGMSKDDPGNPVNAESAAYVMYTSGSTGRPKGVVIPHRAVVRLVINNGYAEIGSSDCVVHASNPAFDASTFEVWGALLNGARLLIVPPSVVLEPLRFAELLKDKEATVLWLTAGLFAQYTEALSEVFPRLRLLLVGGDVVDVKAVGRVMRSGRPEKLLNGYGPTECTTFSATHVIAPPVTQYIGTIPIGRPIANTTIYLLNAQLQPVPVGVTGEIYIGGLGLALGYHQQPGLTAERFVASPFSDGMRIYKSGDLGKRRDDGSIEFLGRNDHQIKLRGFRIELTEIEAQLLRHPYVKEAAVLLREDEPGDRRIAAYVVPDLVQLKAWQRKRLSEATAEIVTQWKTLYEETYSSNASGPSFVGWNSSYTGLPIPETEMREWLDGTVHRIAALKPASVLEIGCGVGLLVERLAPGTERYVGTDFSAAAISQLRGWMKNREGFGHVELMQRSASELEDMAPGSFDTVVLNSVVQYFPDIEYLLQVLQQAVRLLRDGGTIFIGDVRHLGLLPTFHSAVQLSRAAATINVGQLRRRVARAISQDKELVIDPEFFRDLPGRVAGIATAELQLKRGRATNELTQYRYDVLLRKGVEPGTYRHSVDVPWQEALGSVPALEAALRLNRWPAAKLHRIANLRLARDQTAVTALESLDEKTDAGSVRRQISGIEVEAFDPDQFWRLGESLGYEVRVTPCAVDSHCFDVELFDRSKAHRTSPLEIHSSSREWQEYANDPMENLSRQQLVPQLREHLKERLPEYMVPSAWLVLKQLPLTPNGKIDRGALPSPQTRPEEAGEYIAPTTELERVLADLWAQILRVDQVGVHDNFFELGGHSLLATQVVVRVQSLLSIEIPVRLLFDFPTVQQLAPQVDSLREERLLDEIDDGGERIEKLLEEVAAMPDSEVAHLVHKLRMEGRRQ